MLREIGKLHSASVATMPKIERHFTMTESPEAGIPDFGCTWIRSEQQESLQVNRVACRLPDGSPISGWHGSYAVASNLIHHSGKPNGGRTTTSFLKRTTYGANRVTPPITPSAVTFPQRLKPRPWEGWRPHPNHRHRPPRRGIAGPCGQGQQDPPMPAGSQGDLEYVAAGRQLPSICGPRFADRRGSRSRFRRHPSRLFSLRRPGRVLP